MNQGADFINQILARKRAQTRISCTNGNRKMRIKRKKNFEVRYMFTKFFSRNLWNLWEIVFSKTFILKSIKTWFWSFYHKIVFDIWIWFYFEITLTLPSPFAEDMQFGSFHSILAEMASGLGLKFQNLWHVY